MSSAVLHHRGRPRKYRVPKGFARELGAPFERVLKLGAHRDGLRYFEAGVVALLAHGLVVLLAVFGRPAPLVAAPPKKREIVVTAAPPPPPPVPKPEPPPPEVPKAEKPRMARNAPPPPTPKQAGKVIAAAADPNAPMDMTGFSMPVGEGKYEGGLTASKAPPPGPTPVAEARRPKPRPPPAPVGPSLAKPPGPARRDWTCTWPDDEQDTDLRDAKVSIRVSVSIDGAPDQVEVLSTPKPSFGQAARACALAETYRPALDTAGNRMAAATPPFNVHFVR
jgi:hypothetical protein